MVDFALCAPSPFFCTRACAAFPRKERIDLCLPSDIDIFFDSKYEVRTGADVWCDVSVQCIGFQGSREGKEVRRSREDTTAEGRELQLGLKKPPFFPPRLPDPSRARLGKCKTTATSRLRFFILVFRLHGILQLMKNAAVAFLDPPGLGLGMIDRYLMAILVSTWIGLEVQIRCSSTWQLLCRIRHQ